MERRDFLKMAGVVAAGGAYGAAGTGMAQSTPATGTVPGLPAAVDASAAISAQVPIPEPGTYRLIGRVRMLALAVEVGGITNAQRISRSLPAGAPQGVVEFTSVDYFPAPGLAGGITVQGGVLEALTATRFDVG